MAMSDGNIIKTYQEEGDTTTADWDDALLFEVAVDPFQKIAISGREEGRAAGLRDGYLEGVNIGRSKGWEIGLELGYIHDFAQGIVDGHMKRLDDHQQQQNIPEHRTSHRLERCLTLSRDLVKMIHDFPDPDSLLSSQNHGDRETYSVDESTKTENSEVTSDGGCCITSDNHCIGKSADNNCCKSSSIQLESSDEDNKEDDKATNFLNFGKGKIPATGTTKSEAMLDVSAPLERIRAKFKLVCVLLKTKQPFDLKNVLALGNGEGKGSSTDQGGNGEKSSARPVKGNYQSRDAGLENTVQKVGNKESNGNLPVNDLTGIESDW